MKVNQVIQALREPFWTADGSTQAAELLVAGQPMFDPSNIDVSAVWSTDWQGTIELAPYERTNLAPYSQTIGGTGWTDTGASAVLNNVLAPDGSMTMSTLTGTASVNTVYLTAGFAMAANTTYQLSVYLSQGTTLSASIYIRDGSLANIIARQNVNWSGGVPTLAGSTGILSVDIVPAANGTYLLTYTFNSGVYTTGTIYMTPDNNAAGRTLNAWGSSVTLATDLGKYIPTTTAPVTQVDYSLASDMITFGYLPLLGASFTWSGTANITVLSAMATVLAQYANSPTIVALIDYMNQWLDPTVALGEFYDMIWNVETAQGEGLDIWGTIVDIPRTIQLVPPDTYFGFETSVVNAFYPFNSEPFYSGPLQGEQFTLSDDAYRVLIMTKALANISAFTAPSVNSLLRYLFAGRGSCYVLDLGGMQMQYVFNFALQPWESSVLQQPQLMPRPAGVGVTITVNP